MSLKGYCTGKNKAERLQLEKAYPTLANFLGCNFPATEFDAESDEEVIKRCYAPKDYYEKVFIEGCQLLAQPYMPWHALSFEGNLHFSDEQDAREWLGYIIELLEAQLKNM